MASWRLGDLLLRAAVVVAVLVCARSARAAGDPHLEWRTFETRHFRVTYYSGEEEVARHVAELAESINARLAPAVGYEPTEKTEVVLTDGTDGANGSATALPYNAIRLFITAPDDLSPLGDVDDWYLELVTHEYTHILHTDHIGGIPAIVNKVLGKTLAPNQVEPRWMLEGLAVFEESARTSGGRLRSSVWNMYMRADVLEDNVAPLDVFSAIPRRWPQGNIWYLYGSFFLRWIADTYGEQAIRAMIDDYGQQLIPFGVNRSIRRATGRTFEELYPAWVGSMRRQYADQVKEIERRGRREGVRLTHLGQTAQKPRFIPARAWGQSHEGEILYALDDGHTTSGLYRLPLDRDARGVVVGARERERELMIRTNGVSAASFEPDGSVVFTSVDVHNNLYSYYDLFEIAAGERSPLGLEGNRSRWTDGFRAIDADVSPDGRRVVFTTNHRGTTYLQIADVTPDGIANVHALVRTATWDQSFGPRWAPDNRHVAYSTWQKGGYRDIRYVDTADGSYVDVTHDRAIDGGPSFSKDGKWLFFHSDRTGISNLYAWEVGTKDTIRQVTNVLTGAFQPEPSPDGKSIVYVGYTSRGFDLYAMPLDPSTWTEPAPYVEHRPTPPAPPERIELTSEPYNAWKTLQPRRYQVQITPGNFGEASILTATDNDIANHHAFAATITTEWEKPEFQGSLEYVYGRLPFDVSVRAFRAIAPRTDFAIGPYQPQWIEEQIGFASAISYALPRAFDGQTVSASYTAARVGGELPAPADKLDPYETPAVPQRGMLASVHFGWAYSNAQRYLWSVGPEKGFSLSAGLDLSDPAIASDFTGYAVNMNFATYYLMPWLEHHSLALHAGGGTGGGNLGDHGLFYVGGFVDLPLVDTVRNTLFQSGIVLRGYPVVALAGRNYALFNGEYRFPIYNVDRGLSTLPVFLNRITGAAFVDYGSAFDDAGKAQFKTGVGGELWFDTTVGYVTGMTFRVGYARGLASGGIDKTYVVAAIPF